MVELPDEMFVELCFELDLIRVEDALNVPTDLLVEQRERGLIVVMDHAGVVVDRGRDSNEMLARVATALRALPESFERLEGRRLIAGDTDFVCLPSAAIQLAGIRRQLQKSGVEMPAELGWQLEDLEGATLLAGPMDPQGSRAALVAAVAGTCRTDAEDRPTLASVGRFVSDAKQAFRVAGPPSELRDLIVGQIGAAG